VGSVGVAAGIAYIAFPVLLVCGLMSGDLGIRGLVMALLACVLARAALSYVPNSDGMFFSAVAVVDIALVFVVFKGDVRL
jgi:hypothetical protein